MVDGARGCVGHVARHAVEEHKIVLENVTTLHLTVEEMVALA